MGLGLHVGGTQRPWTLEEVCGSTQEVFPQRTPDLWSPRIVASEDVFHLWICPLAIIRRLFRVCFPGKLKYHMQRGESPPFNPSILCKHLLSQPPRRSFGCVWVVVGGNPCWQHGPWPWRTKTSSNHPMRCYIRSFFWRYASATGVKTWSLRCLKISWNWKKYLSII